MSISLRRGKKIILEQIKKNYPNFRLNEFKEKNRGNSFMRLPLFNSEKEKQTYLDDLKKGKRRFPIIQGGMGVQISDVESATSVTKAGGIGTISGSLPGADETYSEYERNAAATDEKNYTFAERSHISKLNNLERFKKDIDDYANNTGYQIRAANIMKAVSDFQEMVKAAGESKKIDMLFVGAGMYRDCADHAKKYPHMQIIPIVSSSKVAGFYNKLTKRQKQDLGAIYVEHPFAGGHDGYDPKDDYNNEEDMTMQYDSKKLYKEISEAAPRVQLLLGGNGIASHEDVKDVYDTGFSGAVVGTLFAMAKESGFDDDMIIRDIILNKNFKIIVTKMSSAGMPSTIVGNGFYQNLVNMLEKEKEDENGRVINLYKEYFKEVAGKYCSDCIGTHCGFKKQQGGEARKNREILGGKEKPIACVALELVRTLRAKTKKTLEKEKPPLVFAGKVRDRAIEMPFFQEKGKDGKVIVRATEEIYDMLAGEIFM